MVENVNVKEPLTEEEKAGLYKKLFKANQLKDEITEQKRQILEKYGEEINNCKSDIKEIMTLLGAGYREEVVECEVKYNNEEMTRTVTRLDSGRTYTEPIDELSLMG